MERPHSFAVPALLVSLICKRKSLFRVHIGEGIQRGIFGLYGIKTTLYNRPRADVSVGDVTDQF